MDVLVMKLFLVTSVLAAATSLAGCAAHGSGLVLDPVGPPPLSSSATGPDGTLRVFSAFEQGADFNSATYCRHFTDYKVLSANGRLVQAVQNNTSAMVAAPKRVELPPGTYRVVARANGYGQITVPVIIKPGQVTTLHLEGGSAWANREALATSNPVRLPGGEIAGWRSVTADSLDPAHPGPGKVP
jgi:hypothetical protein